MASALLALATAAVLSGAAAPALPTLSASDLFDEPRLSCRLRALLGPSGFESLASSMQLIDSQGAGQRVFRGGVRGLYTIKEGIVVVGPSGALSAAFIGADDRVHVFSEAEVPTDELDGWRERFAEKAVVREKGARWVDPDCAAERLARRVAEYELKKQGGSCSAVGAAFDGVAAAIVRPAASKSWFHSAPAACPADGPCASRSRAFVVAGDAVELSSNVERRDGFLCARYRGKRDTVGWLREADLERGLPKKGLAGAQPASAWLGEWVGPLGMLRIRPGEGDGAALRVSGVVSVGAHAGEIDEPLRADGDLMVAGAPEGCELRMQLANGALFAADGGSCSGVGVFFDGLYQRKR